MPVRWRTKWSATVTMAACAVIVSFTAHRAWMAVVLAWVWSRPLPPPQQQ